MTMILRRLCLCLVATLPLALQSQTAETITLDNTDAIFEGNWTQASSSNDRHGKDYKFSSTVIADSPTSSATYTPNFKSAGKYHVEIMYPQGQNRSVMAKWFIKFDGASETVTVNQQMNGGVWTRIATAKPFAAGTSGSVQVQNNTGVI